MLLGSHNRTNSERLWVFKKFGGSTIIYAVLALFCLVALMKYEKYTFFKEGNLQSILVPQICEIPELKSPEQFFQKLAETEFPCKNLITVGGKPSKYDLKFIDGDKKVCMDRQYQLIKGNCTVLSFGISDDWSFDDEMDNHYQCKVHSFDPTIGLLNHKRSSRINFYNLGFGNKDGQVLISGLLARVTKYSSIIDRLNLRDLYIDYLKIDIEGAEVNFFNEIFGSANFLLKNIKQIGLEIHPGFFNFNNILIHQFWTFFHKMECNGFQIAFSQPNLIYINPYTLDGKVRSHCYEVLWLNTKLFQVSE